MLSPQSSSYYTCTPSVGSYKNRTVPLKSTARNTFKPFFKPCTSYISSTYNGGYSVTSWHTYSPRLVNTVFWNIYLASSQCIAPPLNVICNPFLKGHNHSLGHKNTCLPCTTSAVLDKFLINSLSSTFLYLVQVHAFPIVKTLNNKTFPSLYQTDLSQTSQPLIKTLTNHVKLVRPAFIDSRTRCPFPKHL